MWGSLNQLKAKTGKGKKIKLATVNVQSHCLVESVEMMAVRSGDNRRRETVDCIVPTGRRDDLKINDKASWTVREKDALHK